VAIARTLQQRPDLIEARGGLTEAEAAALEGEVGITYPVGSPAHLDPEQSRHEPH
jgi:hypothetical protein